MKVIAIKTPLFKKNGDLFTFLKENLPQLKEKSVVVITSKIVSYSQNCFIPKKTSDREEKLALVRQEADRYIEHNMSVWDVMITVKGRTMAINAGIDESNSVNGEYILWPKNLQEITNQIWQFLRKEYKLKEVGVILTDSKTTPLTWGMIGTAISYCGFSLLNDYRQKEDLFGREMKVTQVNVAEAIAAAAVLEMGEVNEAKPLAVVEDVSSIQFQDNVPTQQELADLTIEVEEDLYAPILKAAQWEKGGGGD